MPRAKSRGKSDALTVKDVKAVWGRQDGHCVYLGAALVPPSFRRANNKVLVGSPGRIDSSKDSMQVVSAAVNHMKGALTPEETITRSKLIALHWNSVLSGFESPQLQHCSSVPAGLPQASQTVGSNTK